MAPKTGAQLRPGYSFKQNKSRVRPSSAPDSCYISRFRHGGGNFRTYFCISLYGRLQ